MKDVLERIATALGSDLERNFIIEVGPGPGSLTRAILNLGAKQLLAIEKDTRFFPTLKQLEDASESCLKLIMGDALEISENQIRSEFLTFPNIASGDTSMHYPRKVQVIANLPFNIATTLLVQWLKWMSNYKVSDTPGVGSSSPNNPGLFSNLSVELILMFQKEVAKRITAVTNTPEMSRISILAQYICDVKYLFTIPGAAFVPVPKVDAGVVKLTKKPNLRLPISMDKMILLLTVLYASRRKTLRAILGRNLGSEEADTICEFLKIPPTTRPEQLDVNQITHLGIYLDSKDLFLSLSSSIPSGQKYEL